MPLTYPFAGPLPDGGGVHGDHEAIPHTEAVGELGSYPRLYEPSLRAANRAESTVYKYPLAVHQLVGFLTDTGMPTKATAVHREHVEAYLADFLEHHKASTTDTRYQSLRVFFNSLVDEGEITASPMARMKPPIVPEGRTAVLTEDQLRALLKTCATKTLEDLRDVAILRLFIDTGMRLAELTGLRVVDIDEDHDVALVLGKGRRGRAYPFGDKTALAVVRYLTERKKRGYHGNPLWLGLKVPMTTSGVRQDAEPVRCVDQRRAPPRRAPATLTGRPAVGNKPNRQRKPKRTERGNGTQRT